MNKLKKNDQNLLKTFCIRIYTYNIKCTSIQLKDMDHVQKLCGTYLDVASQIDST